MRQLEKFSRVSLGILPTPLYKLENLSRECGRNFYIKRDDLTGVALGGNKVRRLARTEGLLADPVYSGKALAGMFRLLDGGWFGDDENILFVHTGGAGALFSMGLPEE